MIGHGEADLLHRAIETKSAEKVRLMLEHKASTTSVYHREHAILGTTKLAALGYAIRKLDKPADIVSLLLQHKVWLCVCALSALIDGMIELSLFRRTQRRVRASSLFITYEPRSQSHASHHSAYGHRSAGS